MSDRLKLNSLDNVTRRVPTTVVYKYDGYVDEEKVRSYFENLKKRYPQLSSSYSTEGNFAYLNYNDEPLNFTTSTIETEPQLDPFTDQARAKILVPAFTGNFFVHITKVKQPQISYITVSVSHGICDGEGMINVLLRNDSTPEPPMDLSKIVAPANWGRKEAGEWGWPVAKPSSTIDFGALTSLSFTFTNSRIEELKTEARNGKTDLKGRIISTNDVLCAYMWKISAMVREDDPLDQIYSFGEVVNFRRILNMGNNYPWNAATRITLNNLTRKMVLDSDLSEIAVLLRNLAESFTPEVVKNTLCFLEKEYENGTIDELGVAHDPVHGFWVSNWSKFDLYNNSVFDEKHRAKEIVYVWPFFLPWFSFVFPKADNNGVEWMISCPEKYKERFLQLVK